MKMRRDNQIQMRKYHDSKLPTKPPITHFILYLDTPGPGSYMPPSEFGYLDLYKYTNSPRSSIMQGDFSSRNHTSYKTNRQNSVMGHTGPR